MALQRCVLKVLDSCMRTASASDVCSHLHAVPHELALTVSMPYQPLVFHSLHEAVVLRVAWYCAALWFPLLRLILLPALSRCRLLGFLGALSVSVPTSEALSLPVVGTVARGGQSAKYPVPGSPVLYA